MSLRTRIGQLLGHTRSIRGMFLVFSAVSATAALRASGVPQLVLAVSAIATGGAGTWLTSARLSSQRTQMMRLAKVVDKLEEARQQNSKRGPGHPALYGPTARNRDLENLERIRKNLAGIRSRIVSLEEHKERSVPESPVESGGSVPVVTIAIALHDDANNIESTIESIRSQEFESWECLVVDDASTDASVAEAARFMSVDSRITVVRHKVRAGRNASWNTALRLAHGRLLLPLISGDVLAQDALLRLVESHSRGRAVAGSCSLSSELEVSVQLPRDASFLDVVTAPEFVGSWKVRALVDRQTLTAVGGFDESSEDGDAWGIVLEMARRGHVFAIAGADLIRKAPMSTSEILALRPLLDASATAVADRSVLMHGWSPDTAGLGRLRLTQAEIGIRAAVSAIVHGDSSIEDCLSSLSPRSLALIERHVDIGAILRGVLREALGAESVRSGFDSDVESIRDFLTQAVDSAVGPEIAATDSEDERPSVDVLFLPQDAHQVRLMATLSGAVRHDLTVQFIDTDRIEGNQGTGIALAELGIEPLSVNEWHVRRPAVNAVVIAHQRGESVNAIASEVFASGGNVVEITQATDAVLVVEDAAVSEFKVVTMSPEECAVWLRQTTLLHRGEEERVNTPSSVTTPLRPELSQLREESPEIRVDYSGIEAFRDRHVGERCFIIGNGPSLNDLQLSKMSNDVTFGVNGIFYAADQMGFDPTYYVVEDTMVVRDNLPAIVGYQAGHKFFPSIYRTTISERENVTYFNLNQGFYLGGSSSHCVPRFSVDAAQRLFSGQSVTTINLQLAYYMGFEEVVLIGMDFTYSVPPDAVVEGNHIMSMSDDPNHFHPDYFGKGKTWKDPKLDRVLANYQLAKLMFEADGRRIVNATAGGQLELFERVQYDSLFS